MSRRLRNLAYRARVAAMARPWLARLARTVLAVHAAVVRPPLVPPGHWASPMTASGDIERALRWPVDLPGVDLGEERQVEWARRLAPAMAESLPGPVYSAGPENSMYLEADAAIYDAMLREVRPGRVMEIGSGYSTAVALDVARNHLPSLEVRCVEPFPDRLLTLVEPGDQDRLRLDRCGVQDLPLDEYESLHEGDILFIDSSHVAKAGSDVLWLTLHVLPRLSPGVIVHVHDIFWPFEYPAAWLRERRDWTEGYLLHAFLLGNDSWEILLFSSWLWDAHPELIPDRLAGGQPGGLWMRRRKT